jgi:uncharacterized membrane protein
LTAIEKIGAELTHYFPANGAHRNEQSDKPIVM